VRSGVDAVVVNYRTPDDLARFVTSWQKHEPEELWVRLVIVNVSPTPEDTEVAESFHRRGDIEVVQYFDNIGYGRACNLGAERPHGDGFDVIALFNADVELRAGAVEECYFALTSQDEWGVLGPRQVDDRGRLVHAGIVGPPTKPRHRGWQEPDRGQYVDVLDDVPTVSGSAYFIKRKAWVQLKSCTVHQLATAGSPPGGGTGAFLPTPHYYEETWCSYHARAHGWRCVYNGDVTITHSWHRASPVGGAADSKMSESRAHFRRACDLHGIERD
jgi:GT2 family glycosyltransferase